MHHVDLQNLKHGVSYRCDAMVRYKQTSKQGDKTMAKKLVTIEEIKSKGWQVTDNWKDDMLKLDDEDSQLLYKCYRQNDGELWIEYTEEQGYAANFEVEGMGLAEVAMLINDTFHLCDRLDDLEDQYDHYKADCEGRDWEAGDEDEE